MRTVIITGAIAAKASITLFFLDGSTETLPQENFRTSEILDKVMPALAAQHAAGNHDGVSLDLEQFTVAHKIAAATNGAFTATENMTGEVTMTVGGQAVDATPLIQHAERALLDGSKGFGRFMTKFAEIKRQHTSAELLKFMDNADLPLADDGSIIGYKVLKKTDVEGVFVDGWSGKVKQRLGSLVYMPDSKVDDNRRNLCSTGLHIAARDYINGYGGYQSVLTLVKIQPKDVISVPINETTKMRVAAYHIVKVLSDEDSFTMKNDSQKSLHDLPAALKLLEELVAGDHTPIIERVEVGVRGEHTITPVEVKRDRIERKKKARAPKKVSRLEKKKAEITAKALRIEPKDIRILNKMIQAKPHLADQEPKYLRKLVKAQRMLDDGASLRTIAAKLDIDRDGLSRNLLKKAA